MVQITSPDIFLLTDQTEESKGLRFEILTAVKISWCSKLVLTPCGIVGRYQLFGWTYYFYLQSLIQQCVPPKWLVSTPRPHRVTTHMTITDKRRAATLIAYSYFQLTHFLRRQFVSHFSKLGYTNHIFEKYKDNFLFLWEIMTKNVTGAIEGSDFNF